MIRGERTYRRPVVLVLLVALSITLAAVISIQAIGVIRSRARMVEATVASAADDGARLAAERAEHDIISPLVAPLGAAAFAATSSHGRPRPLVIFAMHIRRELRTCGCLRSNGVIAHIDARGGESESTGGRSTAEDSSTVRWLADTVPAQARLTHRSVRRLVMPPSRGDDAVYSGSLVFGLLTAAAQPSPRLFAYVDYVDSAKTPGEAFVIELDGAGFVARTTRDWSLTTPLATVAGRTVSVPLTLDVADARGGNLFQSTAERWTPSGRLVRLPPDEGSLLLRVYLATDVTGLVQARAGSRQNDGPRVALSVALFAITLALLTLALAQLRREFELARLRARFVSGVSHELRTPLTQIRLFAELLAECGSGRDLQRRDYARIIDEEAQRLTHLVDNVLTFAALGGERRRRRGALALDELVEQTLERFAPLAGARRATVRRHIEAHVDVQGHGDAMRQILINLLDNAVKYGPAGQTVIVRLTTANGSAELSVDDQGPGIPAGDRGRVFEPFFRLPRDADGAAGGSGIGLAVVRELARVQGGTVTLEESARGVGTRMVVRFPVLEARPLVVAEDIERFGAEHLSVTDP